MSSEINEAQEGRAVRVVDADPVSGTPPVISATSGRRGQSDGRAGSATAQEMTMDDYDPPVRRPRPSEVMRAWMTAMATIVASVTYQAGLNPPGGFWQADDDQGHRAGDPVLRDKHQSRYATFYYMNATAFVTSLTIIVLAASERFYHTEAKMLALMFYMSMDLICLIGAYIAGSATNGSLGISYIIVLTCVSFVGVFYIGEMMAEIYKFFLSRVPGMLSLVQLKWFPVTADVARSALQQREERMRRVARSNHQRGGCSACCASAPHAEG